MHWTHTLKRPHVWLIRALQSRRCRGPDRRRWWVAASAPDFVVSVSRLSALKSATSFIAVIKSALIVTAGACAVVRAPVLCYDVDVLIDLPLDMM